jgi:V/A-type H+-transporting ATPase subunit I
MIVGDAGYALISLLLSLLMIKNSKSGGMLNNFAKIWMIGALYSFVFGIAFDEYFGYSHASIIGQRLYSPLLERAKEMPTLLLITILVGWVQVLFGFLLGAANEWEHSRKHAIAKLSWVPIQIGGTFAVMYFLLHATDATTGMAGTGVFALGVAVLLWSEGPIGLVEIPGLASNIMSYARIAAVGVAGVVLAEIINTLVSPNPQLLSSPQGILVFIFVSLLYVILHIVNTIIAMVEGLIHGARLNVVEFFGKFYKGGGKAFAPFREERIYTVGNENDFLEPA